MVADNVENLVELLAHTFEVGALGKPGFYKKRDASIIAAGDDGKQCLEIIRFGILDEPLQGCGADAFSLKFRSQIDRDLCTAPVSGSVLVFRKEAITGYRTAMPDEIRAIHRIAYIQEGF